MQSIETALRHVAVSPSRHSFNTSIMISSIIHTVMTGVFFLFFIYLFSSSCVVSHLPCSVNHVLAADTMTVFLLTLSFCYNGEYSG